jgi:hypothetical protein
MPRAFRFLRQPNSELNLMAFHVLCITRQLAQRSYLALPDVGKVRLSAQKKERPSSRGGLLRMRSSKHCTPG